jgi:Phage integrase family
VALANERLEASGSVPLPEGLTPHKLRHTYTSLLAALGTDPGAMMDLLGHTDPGFTLRVYRHSMRRDPESRDQLRALVGVDDSGTGEVSGKSRAQTGKMSRSLARRGTTGGSKT